MTVAFSEKHRYTDRNQEQKEEFQMDQNIDIRVAEPADAQALLDIYAPYVTSTAITFEYAVPSEPQFTERIRHTLRRYPFLVAERRGTLLGYAYAGPFKERPAYDWAAETTIYVRQDCRRQGIGRRLYQALESALNAQGILNLNACIAYPEPEDEYLTKDSVLFHQRMCFQPVGTFHNCGYKFHRWYHMVWMEKQIGIHKQNQPAVQPFSALRAACFPSG